MQMKPLSVLAPLLFFSCTGSFASPPVEAIPPQAALVVAVDDPVSLLDVVTHLPIDQLQDEVPSARLAMSSTQMLAFRGGVMWVEGQLGAKYDEILKVAAGRGLAIGVENEKSLVVLGRSAQPERLEGLLRTAAQLAKGMKVGRNAPAPEPEGSHRGIDAYKIGDAAVAVVKDILLISNNGDLAKSTIDRILDNAQDQISARLPVGDSTSVRILLRHEALPNIQQQIAKAKAPSDDFGRELILGGALSVLSAEGATAALANLSSDGLSVRWTIDRRGTQVKDNGDSADQQESASLHNDDPAELDKIRAGIVMNPASELNLHELPVGQLAGIELPKLLDGTIAQFTVDRRVGRLWAEKDNLLTENAAAQLDVADSQLSTAFGGFDVGDEVLGALQPTFRLVVLPPSSTNLSPPVLPEAAFLAVLNSENPGQVARRFRIAWQTIIGIINVERGGNSQPQLELETFSDNDLKMMTGRYSQQDAEELNADSVDLYSSLAPTIASRQERILVATSDLLARKLLDTNEFFPELGDGDLISAVVDGESIADLLALNRPALLAQNMLEKGNSRSQAETEIDSLIGGVAFARHFAIRAVLTDEAVHGIAEISWGHQGDSVR